MCTLGAPRPILRTSACLCAGSLDKHCTDDKSTANRFARDQRIDCMSLSPVRETGNVRNAAKHQHPLRSRGSIVDLGLWHSGSFHLEEDCPCNRTCSCVWCSSGYTGISNLAILTHPEQEGRYHWGKSSSQRMCLLLQVLQPFLDLV